MSDEQLIAARTRVVATKLLPELSLHVAESIVPLWEETREQAPPYWGFPWVGGQALARYLLDHPALVAGKRVLDIGTGSGVCAIAAARSGACSVRATDIDRRAIVAAAHNAAINGVVIELLTRDVLDDLVDDDVIVAGDVCYERPLSDRVFAFLRRHAARALVLIGDPGRAYFANEGLELLARYEVPTTRDLEGRDSRAAGVFRVRA